MTKVFDKLNNDIAELDNILCSKCNGCICYVAVIINYNGLVTLCGVGVLSENYLHFYLD